MLHYSNLQFTNATQLNDPFDCHPSLIDFSNVPKEACGGWTPEIIEELRRDPFRRTREEAWICSLSKIYDSILMWSYYSKHKGICIGLDMEKERKAKDKFLKTIVPEWLEKARANGRLAKL